MPSGPEHGPGAWRRHVRAGWPVAIIITWATVLFWPTLFSNRALFWHDASIQNIPLRKCLREAVAADALPVWSWTYGGGYPVGCDVQSGLFYPLQAFDLTGLVTPERGFAVSAWLHFVLAGVGMWVFLGGHGIGAPGRLMAALGYMGSGFLAGHVMHVHLVWQAAWLPWLLAGLDWLWRKPSWARAVVAGMPLGLALLAGQPVVASYVFFAGLLWSLVSPLPPAFGRPRALAWAAATAGFGLWVGLGPYWAASDLFPASARVLRESGTGGVFDMALDLPYWPLIVHPFLYGSYADNNYFGGAHHYEVCGYIAAPVLVLGLLSLTSGRSERRRLAIAMAVLALVAFFMAAARQNPLYYVLGRLPLLSGSRAHARWVVVLGMSWSAMAAVGTEIVLRAPTRRRVAVVGALAVVVWAGVPLLARAGRPVVVSLLAAHKPEAQPAEHKAAEKYEQMLKRLSWWDPYWVGLGLAGAALLGAGTARLGSAAIGLCLATVALEGALYVRTYLPTVPLDYYRQPPHTAQVIKSDPGPVYVDPACREHQRPPVTYRGWSRDGTGYYMAEREVMRPNRSPLWGITGAQCIMPLASASQLKTISKLVPALLADVRTRPAGYRLLASVGVKWVIVSPDRAPAGARPVAKTIYSALYRLPEAQPPVRVCTGPLVLVGSNGLHPADVEKLPSANSALVSMPGKLPAGDGQVRQLERRPDGSLSLVADVSKPALVLLGVPLYPAHRATVDGKPVRLVRVNGYSAGLMVPPGKHTLHLWYDPTKLGQAAAIYASSWIVFLAALAVLAWRRKT